jgi:hypothetical protein
MQLVVKSHHWDASHRLRNTSVQYSMLFDRPCGLVVRVLGYRSWDLGFDSRRYQIFWEVVGLERGPLSLVRIIEELLEWKSSGLRSRKPKLTAVGIRCADHAKPLYPQKLALTSPTCGGRSVGIVRLRTTGHGVIVCYSFFQSFIIESTALCWALASSVSWSNRQSVGLLGREICPSQGRYLHTGQHKQNKRIHTPNIHALSGIRTHDSSVRAGEDSSCLRPHATVIGLVCY